MAGRYDREACRLVSATIEDGAQSGGRALSKNANSVGGVRDLVVQHSRTRGGSKSGTRTQRTTAPEKLIAAADFMLPRCGSSTEPRAVHLVGVWGVHTVGLMARIPQPGSSEGSPIMGVFTSAAGECLPFGANPLYPLPLAHRPVGLQNPWARAQRLPRDKMALATGSAANRVRGGARTVRTGSGDRGGLRRHPASDHQ